MVPHTIWFVSKWSPPATEVFKVCIAVRNMQYQNVSNGILSELRLATSHAEFAHVSSLVVVRTQHLPVFL